METKTKKRSNTKSAVKKQEATKMFVLIHVNNFGVAAKTYEQIWKHLELTGYVKSWQVVEYCGIEKSDTAQTKLEKIVKQGRGVWKLHTIDVVTSNPLM